MPIDSQLIVANSFQLTGTNGTLFARTGPDGDCWAVTVVDGKLRFSVSGTEVAGANPYYPDAIGAGRETQGGYFGNPSPTVYNINSADDEVGFRAAMLATDARIINLNFSGVMLIPSVIEPTFGSVTIDGTAGNPTLRKASGFQQPLLRWTGPASHIRIDNVRLENVLPSVTADADCLQMASCEYVYIKNVTAAFSSDEVFGFAYCNYVTWDRCAFLWPLIALDHNYGPLCNDNNNGNSGYGPATSYRCVYGHQAARSPRFMNLGVPPLECLQSISYNCNGGVSLGSRSIDNYANVIDQYYKPGYDYTGTRTTMECSGENFNTYIYRDGEVALSPLSILEPPVPEDIYVNPADDPGNPVILTELVAGGMTERADANTLPAALRTEVGCQPTTDLEDFFWDGFDTGRGSYVIDEIDVLAKRYAYGMHRNSYLSALANWSPTAKVFDMSAVVQMYWGNNNEPASFFRNGNAFNVTVEQEAPGDLVQGVARVTIQASDFATSGLDTMWQSDLPIPELVWNTSENKPPQRVTLRVRIDITDPDNHNIQMWVNGVEQAGQYPRRFPFAALKDEPNFTFGNNYSTAPKVRDLTLDVDGVEYFNWPLNGDLIATTGDNPVTGGVGEIVGWGII